MRRGRCNKTIEGAVVPVCWPRFGLGRAVFGVRGGLSLKRACCVSSGQRTRLRNTLCLARCRSLRAAGFETATTAHLREGSTEVSSRVPAAAALTYSHKGRLREEGVQFSCVKGLAPVVSMTYSLLANTSNVPTRSATPL